MVVRAALADVGRDEHGRVVEHVVLALGHGLEPLQERANLLDLPQNALGDLLWHARVGHAVGQRVVVVTDLDPRHRSGTERIAETEGDDTREIATVRELHHVHHCAEALDVVGAVGRRRRVLAFERHRRRVQLLFDRAHAGQILIELDAVFARQLRRQAGCLRHQVVEHALVPAPHALTLLDGERGVLGAQQPEPGVFRIGALGARRRFVAPRQRLGVSAGVAGVAVANAAGFGHAELERRARRF